MEGLPNRFHSVDLRLGGGGEFTLHGPNGVDNPHRKYFVEIVEEERIVFHHAQPMPVFPMTLRFAPTGYLTNHPQSLA